MIFVSETMLGSLAGDVRRAFHLADIVHDVDDEVSDKTAFYLYVESDPGCWQLWAAEGLTKRNDNNNNNLCANAAAKLVSSFSLFFTRPNGSAETVSVFLSVPPPPPAPHEGNPCAFEWNACRARRYLTRGSGLAAPSTTINKHGGLTNTVRTSARPPRVFFFFLVGERGAAKQWKPENPGTIRRNVVV